MIELIDIIHSQLCIHECLQTFMLMLRMKEQQQSGDPCNSGTWLDVQDDSWKSLQ